jgi:hypothetical protein
MRRLLNVSGLVGLLWLGVAPLRADDEVVQRGVRIHNLKVLSNKVDDVTTHENILKSFIKPGMSDAERARALWTAAVKYRHQTAPPNEFLASDWEAHDPVKLFNVYGYCMCCCSSALIEALNRLDGREARGRILNGHSVPEVFYDGAWHMYDASLLTYFPKPGNGSAASVDEIAQAVTDWYGKNPGYRKNPDKLTELMRGEQWNGWRTRGPELLANCPFYQQGFFPARTHGWNDTMAEYDRKSEIYEYGYQVGHRSLFSLRPGESFVREAGNRGRHINQDAGWDQLKSKAPQRDLVYLKTFYPGYTGGVVGNGYHRYAPNLAANGLAAGAELYENLAAGGSPALHLKTTGKPGVAVIPVESPYVYLGGRLSLKGKRKLDSDKIAVSISTNHGRSFEPLWRADRVGAWEANLDLKEKIIRRYAYWIKVEIISDSADGTGLDLFSVENDIQHAPRTLPWLGPGDNTITVAADRDAGFASRAFTCRITPSPGFDKNESSTSMGVVFDNLNVSDGSCWWKGGVGTVTIPLATPGDMAGLNFSTQFRARGQKDLIKALFSFDQGKTWKEAARMVGPTQGRTEYHHFADIPSHSRSAFLRYELTGNNTVGILSFRVDADYRDPAATTDVSFYVTHRWKEKGVEKVNRQRIAKQPFSYELRTDVEPEMVSVSYEMPAQ